MDLTVLLEIPLTWPCWISLFLLDSFCLFLLWIVAQVMRKACGMRPKTRWSHKSIPKMLSIAVLKRFKNGRKVLRVARQVHYSFGPHLELAEKVNNNSSHTYLQPEYRERGANDIRISLWHWFTYNKTMGQNIRRSTSEKESAFRRMRLSWV